ncbi:MAG: hypothetical protein LHW64_06830 [Candidatus Cloacimonetes bacterium]|jgi:hypothetical protein|nr:hypothetical protein [Candidatus Cloacimonadota bacterium]MCB5287500.1 hypothetical protein [Candidatus Cloacimonadota bacterium]MCK9185265.1 hypothetical protein [Candidatus Cloacimonadota bacterium]MDY0229821.1 hypothetical protein [Candidatus Cloacimonadaceae bacterium]
MAQAKAKRSVAKKTIQSMPDNGQVCGAGTALVGTFGGISIFGAAFPDDATSYEINGVGVNLSQLNGVCPDGWTYISHFTKITIAAGSTMVLVVYGF